MQVAASVAGLGGVFGSRFFASHGVSGLATGNLVNVHGLTVLSIMSLLCIVFVVSVGAVCSCKCDAGKLRARF